MNRIHPRLHQYLHQHTIDWSRKIERVDAFVFVTPEYNFGYSAALKNAIDYLSERVGEQGRRLRELRRGVAAGTRAVQQLKQVVTALKMVPVVEIGEHPLLQPVHRDESGQVRPNDAMARAADAMLDELLRVTTLLRPHTAEVRPGSGGLQSPDRWPWTLEPAPPAAAPRRARRHTEWFPGGGRVGVASPP